MTEIESDAVQPLIDEPYNYDNIIQNPIVLPISEADKSIRDVQELIDKKLHDALADREWIKNELAQTPEYSDSTFIARLLKLYQETDDIIKLLILQKESYRNCIKKTYRLVVEKYGVKVSGRGDNLTIKAHERKIPGGNERAYLEKLTKHSDDTVISIAKSALERYDNDTEEDTYKRFSVVLGTIYSELKEKKQKDIVAKIIRMEL